MSEMVAPGIYRMKIELPKSPLRYTNSYVIMGERPLVVDTAFNREECKASLRREMAEIGITCEGTDLFLTHFHSDHAGLAGLWNEVGSRVYISETDAILAEATTDGRVDAEREFFRKTGMPDDELATLETTHPGFYFASSEKINYTTCREEDVISAGDYNFRCVSVPGHTPGHMCLFDEASGLLIGGDHILFDITPNIVEWDCLPDSLGQYRKSLEKIRELNIREVLPGHRETGDVYERIAQLLVHHDARLNEVVEILENNRNSGNDMTTYDITKRLSWSIRAKDWDDFPMTQKWFAVGEAQAHITYLVNTGKIQMHVNDRNIPVYRLQ